jgi:hypothetical protein
MVYNQLGQSFSASCEHKVWLHKFDVGWSMVLGKRVGKVGVARPKINQKLALAHAVLQPVPSHVHGLRSLLLHGVVGETFSSGVVDLHGGRGLMVA